MSERVDHLPVPAHQQHPVDQVGGQVGAVVPFASDQGPRHYWTSLDLSTEYGQALAVRARNNADVQVDQLKSEPYQVSNYFAHQVEIAHEETGEITQAVRLVLIDPSGRTLAMVSAVAVDGFAFLLSLLGPAPWDPPRLIRVEQFSTRCKRRAYKLELVLPPPPPPNGRRRS